MTADEAIALLHKILDTTRQKSQLNDTQLKVFRQIWLGKPYATIAEATGYEYDYIKQVGSKLWHLLSKLLNQPVSKRNLQTVFQQIQQSSELESSPSQGIRYQNLPVCNYSTFVGREAETATLLSFLSFEQTAHCISIEGCGGIGKTTLALSIAHRFLQPPTQFEAIIFASAKPNHLTAAGILSRLQPDRNLGDIFRSIAYTLQCPNILLHTFDEQFTQIQARLSRQRTLLLVDNLETVEDWQSILSFLYDLPATVKVMLTSRQRTQFPAIALASLSKLESVRLIQAHAVGIDLNLSATHCLYQQTTGIPAAIVYAVSLLANGYPIESFTQSIATGDYARFYVQSSLMLLRNDGFHALFMAISLFPQSSVKEAIAAVADITDLDTLTQGLAKLQQLSLISQQEERYTLLPLIREYAIAELNAQAEFKTSGYERQVKWYLTFAETHGGKDQTDWQNYSPLEQEWDNVQAVMERCIADDRYVEVCQLWQKIRCYSHAQGYRSDRLTCWATRLDWTD